MIPASNAHQSKKKDYSVNLKQKVTFESFAGQTGLWTKLPSSPKLSTSNSLMQGIWS